MPASTAAPNTNRALFTLWALFWLLMQTVAIQDELDNRYVRWWEPVLWESSSGLVATIWLLIQRHFARRTDRLLDRPLAWFGTHLAWLPVIVITFIPAIYAIRHGIYALTDEI